VEEEVINKGYLDHLELSEILVLPLYIFIIFSLAYIYQRKKIGSNPSYTYFSKALIAKLVGSTAFCLIFVYYYRGGDTFSYFESARSFCNLLLNHPESFMKAYFGGNTEENYSLFDNFTGMPHANIFFETRGQFMTKLITPIVFLGFKSYLISTLLLGAFSFLGIWRMYQVFYKYYPTLYRPIAYGFLFLPTVVFWASGILKDTVTLSCFCWFVSSVEKCFLSKEKRIKNLILLLTFGYVVLIIKPYIMMASLPGLIVLLFHFRVIKIKNSLLKVLTIPFIYVISIGVGIFLISVLADKLDKFSLDKVLDTASVSQKDLKREEYHGNSFDIGDFDPSVQGVISKIPQATVAGLFRPFIWESRNFVMLLSGLENIAILFFVIYPVFTMGPRKIARIFFNQPLLLFIISYSVLFAFSIGISTSNFGALIRFKAAFAPFFVSLLLILYNYKKLNIKPQAIATPPPQENFKKSGLGRRPVVKRRI
jgi:hypothetical protein